MELVQNSGDEGLIPRIAQTTPRIRGNSNAYMFIIAANTSRAERHQPDGNGYDLLILEDLRAVANAVGRKIGGASCRERGCQYVESSVVAGSLEKKRGESEGIT